jgi:hypothetical protein
VKSNRLSAKFNIQPGEERMVALLLLQYFLLGGAFNFVQTAAFTLFLVQFSAQTLAYVYIVNALVGTLIAAIYLRLGQRISFRNLLAANLGFLLALVIGFRLGLGISGADWIVFALPILFQILVNLGNLSFWPLAGRLFNVRQGKRLFGLVGSGQWIAIVLTGFLIPILVAWIGTVNLLILGAVSLIGALVVNRAITRVYATELQAKTEEPAPSKARQSKANLSGGLLRNRYILLVFTLVFLWWLAFFFLDNLFYAVAAVQFPDAEALASFLGLFLGGLGILTLICNFFLTGPVISRYGLQTSLLVLPILLVFGTGSMTLLATLGLAAGLLFWLATSNKLLDMSLGLSIDRAAQTILYQPLPPRQRLQVQTLADGVIQPLSNGAAGLALLALGALFASYTIPLIWGILFIVIAWAITAFWLGREYPRMLVQALAGRRLEGIQMQFCDASSQAALMDGLRNPKPIAAIYAANTLESIDSDLITNALPEMLHHPSPEVRRDALQRIERLGVTSALPLVKEICQHDSSPAVQSTALLTLATLGKSATFDELYGYLDHSDRQVRLSAIVGLVRIGEDAEGNSTAEQRLMAMMGSSQADERLLAAQALGEINEQRYFQSVLVLLGDEDPAVRCAALKSAGRLNHPLLWEQIIQALELRETHAAAEAALVCGGTQALPAIAEAFANSQASRHTLVGLERACGRIQGEEALTLLKNKIGVPDQEVRMQALRSLNRCGYLASSTELGHVKEQIRSELSQATWILRTINLLRDDQELTLLRNALDLELEQSLERAFFLLSFIGGKSILQARENLRLASPEKRAYAQEVIEISTPKEMKSALIPFVEELTPVQQLEHLAVIFPQPDRKLEQGLRDLLTAPRGTLMPWTQAVALFKLKDVSQTDLVATFLTAPEPLLREKAIHTLAKIHPDHREFGRALFNDPDPRVARTARCWTESQNGVTGMLSTVEKVIILKGASIFSETPDNILAEVAQALEEIDVAGEETIFEEGDPGDSMYIVASGRMRVHDGAHTLNTLVEGDVFGEMVLLDPETRVASVTAEEDSLLLQLDQDAFYDLMTDRIEVARGIIQLLSHRLRQRVRDINDLRARYETIQA